MYRMMITYQMKPMLFVSFDPYMGKWVGLAYIHHR